MITSGQLTSLPVNRLKEMLAALANEVKLFYHEHSHIITNNQDENNWTACTTWRLIGTLSSIQGVSEIVREVWTA